MDVERTMQFILDAQARHATALQEHDAILKQHAETLRRNEAQIATVTDLIGRLAQAELRLVEDMRSLRQAQAEAAERMKAADERGRALDERLNILIDIVDKLVRRNGRTH